MNYNKNNKMYPIKIGDSLYYLLLFQNEEEYNTIINICKYSPKHNAYICYYCDKVNYSRVKFVNKFWKLTNNYVLLIYSEPQGSGGFISYEVIGLVNDNIESIVSEENIFQGTVFFKRGDIIRGMSNQFYIWSKENENFVLKPYKMPPYKDAYVIKYSIVDENTVEIDKLNYYVPVGTIIQFIREDFNDVSERLMFSNKKSCLDYIQIATFKITCTSKTTITIIPGAYNWDSAVDVLIKTQKAT